MVEGAYPFYNLLDFMDQCNLRTLSRFLINKICYLKKKTIDYSAICNILYTPGINDYSLAPMALILCLSY